MQFPNPRLPISFGSFQRVLPHKVRVLPAVEELPGWLVDNQKRKKHNIKLAKCTVKKALILLQTEFLFMLIFFI